MEGLDLNILMHLLCVKNNKIQKDHPNQYYWIDLDYKYDLCCVLCGEIINNNFLKKEHALNHLKEYNLLPFI